MEPCDPIQLCTTYGQQYNILFETICLKGVEFERSKGIVDEEFYCHALPAVVYILNYCLLNLPTDTNFLEFTACNLLRGISLEPCCCYAKYPNVKSRAFLRCVGNVVEQLAIYINAQDLEQSFTYFIEVLQLGCGQLSPNSSLHQTICSGFPDAVDNNTNAPNGTISYSQITEVMQDTIYTIMKTDFHFCDKPIESNENDLQYQCDTTVVATRPKLLNIGRHFFGSELVIIINCYLYLPLAILLMTINVTFLVLIVKTRAQNANEILIISSVLSNSALVGVPAVLYFQFVPYDPDNYKEPSHRTTGLTFLIISEVVAPVFRALAVWFIMPISILGFIVITFPIFARNILSKRNVLVMEIVYIIVIVLIIPAAFYPKLRFILDLPSIPYPWENPTYMAIYIGDSTSRGFLWSTDLYTSVLSLLVNIVPFIVMVVFSSILLRSIKMRKTESEALHVQSSQNTPASNSNDKLDRINHLMFSITICCILSAVPYIITDIVMVYLYNNKAAFDLTANYLISFQNTFGPVMGVLSWLATNFIVVLYCFFKQSFVKASLEIFRSWCR